MFIIIYLNFRSKKRKIHTLNSKINSVVSNTSNKTEPKVLYLPNITTNVEPENTEIVSYYKLAYTIKNDFINNYVHKNKDAKSTGKSMRVLW